VTVLQNTTPTPATAPRHPNRLENHPMTTRPFLETEIPATQAVVQALSEAGVQHVFGISGGDTGRIFSRLGYHTDAIRTVLVRNEGHATSAAESYARASGRIGVAMGQGAWILGQGLVGILEAQASGTPMLLLVDLTDGRPFSQHAPYQSGTGDYGNWDAKAAFQAVTKRVFVANTPAEAVQSVQLGIKHALAGQPGPVAVLFSSDSLAGTVGPDSVPRLYATSSYLTSRPRPLPELGDIAAAIARAERPVIISGGGVRMARAEKLLLAVAEATGAPVVTSPAAKGTFPENHPNAAGVFGTFGSPVANDRVAAADLVLVLGSKLGPSDTASESSALLDPASQRFIQIDVEPLNAAWTMPTEDVVVADLHDALESLVAAFAAEPVAADTVSARLAELASVRNELGGFTEAGSDASPMHPRRAIAELRRALPDDAIVCADAGENRLLMSRYFEARGEYLQPAGAGGMGYAIAAAVGVKAWTTDRVVVAVCGDGGFSMSLPALFPSVEEDLPIIVVVLDNGILGWVRHSQLARGELKFNSELRTFDYAAFGEAAGFAGYRVKTPAELSQALETAVASGESSIIVVSVSTDEKFTDLRTPLVGAKR
jgi:acetolactate synthase-1/2/3 large subunit